MRRSALWSSHAPLTALAALAALSALSALGACGKPDAPPPPPPSPATSASASSSTRGCVLPKELAAGGSFTVGGACTVDVAETYVIDRRATLRVEPGATLRFASEAALSLVSGALIAEGTADAPITFTSRETPAKPGGWIGLEAIARSTSELRLSHVVVEGAGEKGRRGSSAIRLVEPPGGVDAGVLPFTLTDSIVRHNAGRGLTNDVRTNRFAKLEGNTFEDDGGTALFVHAEIVVSIGKNRFGDPPWVTGALWTSATWPKFERLVVYKQLAIGAPPGKETTLTLNDGTTLAFEDADLQVGLGEGKSRLVAAGARLTSNGAPASGAAWRGVRVLENGSVALERCAFEATGDGEPAGALVFEGKSGEASSVLGATFGKAKGDAILVHGGGCAALAKAGTREGGGAVCVAR